ncbi:hypothetical protein NKI64_31730 [Mesorhizobium sp. M0478]
MSGISGDTRTLIDSDDPLAAETVDLFVYRIAREIGVAGRCDRRTGHAGVQGRPRPKRPIYSREGRGCGRLACG